MFAILLAADLNVFPLSEIILRGKPLLAVNRLKLLINDSQLRSGTKSRCTALTAQQVYRQIQTLASVDNPGTLMYRGPAKSTPVYENAGSSVTLKLGRGGGGGSCTTDLQIYDTQNTYTASFSPTVSP